MANVRSRIEVEFIWKDNNEKLRKQQSKITFNGIRKPFTNYDIYTIEQNDVLMDKPIDLGFVVLKLSKWLMYKTFNQKLQPYFGEKNIQLHYMDADCFVLSVNKKDINEDLISLENLFDFTNSSKSHELLGRKNEKVIGEIQTETPKKVWIDEFICLRSKTYAFECGSDS